MHFLWCKTGAFMGYLMFINDAITRGGRRSKRKQMMPCWLHTILPTLAAYHLPNLSLSFWSHILLIYKEHGKTMLWILPLKAIFYSEMLSQIRVDPSSKTKSNILQIFLLDNAFKTFVILTNKKLLIVQYNINIMKNSPNFQKEMTTLYCIIDRKKMLPKLPTWP